MICQHFQDPDELVHGLPYEAASARGDETTRVPASSRGGRRHPWWCDSGWLEGQFPIVAFA